MGIKTIYRGLPIEVDSLDQLDELADRLAAQRRVATNGSEHQPTLAPIEPPASNGQSTIADLVARLGSNARNGISVLLENGGSMRDVDYRVALEVTDNMGIGGRITSPLQKLANIVGIDASEIIDRKLISTNPKVWEYFIPKRNEAAIREGLKRGL